MPRTHHLRLSSGVSAPGDASVRDGVAASTSTVWELGSSNTSLLPLAHTFPEAIAEKAPIQIGLGGGAGVWVQTETCWQLLSREQGRPSSAASPRSLFQLARACRAHGTLLLARGSSVSCSCLGRCCAVAARAESARSSWQRGRQLTTLTSLCVESWSGAAGLPRRLRESFPAFPGGGGTSEQTVPGAVVEAWEPAGARRFQTGPRCSSRRSRMRARRSRPHNRQPSRRKCTSSY